MATSNIQQWNPTAQNQENDAQYTSDTLRSGGAANPSILPSATANKLWYQLSTVCAALGQAMANKGYNISDASLSELTSTFQNLLTQVDMSAYAPLQSPSFSGTPKAPTPATGDNSQQIATTAWTAAQFAAIAWVTSQFAPLVSPGLQGSPFTSVPLQGDNSARIPTTSWVWQALTNFAPMNSPSFTGSPSAPNPLLADNSTHIATTAWVKALGFLTGITGTQVTNALGYNPVVNGTGIGQNPLNRLFLGWSGSDVKCTVDSTDLGAVALQTWVNGLFSTRNDGSWFCFTIGGHLEIAVGSGVVNSGSQIPLPTGGYSYAQMKALASPANIGTNSSSSNAELGTLQVSIDGNGTATLFAQGTDGVRWPHGGNPNTQTMNWLGFAWRTF